MNAILFLALIMGNVINSQMPVSEDPFAISEEMKQFLDATINRSQDHLEQLRQLTTIVFQNNVLNFTYQPATRSAIETYNHRGGNCVSFTFLFIAMARYLGMDARFHEVDIAPLWSQVGNLVSVSGHTNVVSYVGSQGYLVDLFPGINRIELGGRIVSDARARAHYFNNLGADQLAYGHSPEATAYFRKAIEIDPTLASVWINLGSAHFNSRQFDEAEKCYKKALELDVKDLIAMNNIGALYEVMGRQSEAKFFHEKTRKFKLKNPYYHFDLGLQAYQSGEYKKSLNHYKVALRLKYQEHNFYLAIARTYFRLGMADQAGKNIKLALKYAPDDASRLRYNEKLTLLASQRLTQH